MKTLHFTVSYHSYTTLFLQKICSCTYYFQQW